MLILACDNFLSAHFLKLYTLECYCLVQLKVQLSCRLYVVDVELVSLQVLLLREGLAALGANVVLDVPVHRLDMLLEGVGLLEGRAALLARMVP